MNDIIRLGVAIALGAASAAAVANDWSAPQEPFALYGNSWYVGTRGISSVLITSPAGHILIDGGPTGSGKQIAEHVRKLGFKVEDIRYILNTHEHFDHAGGIAELQKLSGAAVLGSPENVRVVGSGQPDKGDPQFPSLDPMTPIRKTRAVVDGEVIKLGPLAVTARFTPGHAKGSTSWTWQSTEGGRTANLVFADSLTGIAAKGRRFSRNPGYPDAVAELQKSIGIVAALPCDILVTGHPEASSLWERKAEHTRLGSAAFIDREACSKYAAKAGERLARTLSAEETQR